MTVPPPVRQQPRPQAKCKESGTSSGSGTFTMDDKDVPRSFLDSFLSNVDFFTDELTKESYGELQSSESCVEDSVERPTTPEFLRNLLHRRDVRTLLCLHKTISEYRLKEISAKESDILNLVQTVSVNLLDDLPLTAARNTRVCAGELISLLHKHHVTAAFNAYDAVCNRSYEPEFEDVPHEVDEDEGMAMKVVQLIKDTEPLGATIKRAKDGSIVIARVIHGGLADRAGCINAGDRIVEVNGQTVHGLSPSAIIALLGQNPNSVTFKLLPGANSAVEQDNKAVPPSVDKDKHVSDSGQQGDPIIHVRAMFSYNPNYSESATPCPEASLRFEAGEIIHIVDCSDQAFWQGYLDRDPLCRVGLLPTRALADSRTLLKGSAPVESFTVDKSPSLEGRTQHVRASFRGAVKNHSVQPKTLMFDTFDSSSDNVYNVVSAYEEVAKLYPRSGLIRPVVLIGTAGVGRNELKHRLLLSFPDRYATTVPHTSRLPRSGEQDGVDYHFVSRDALMGMISSGRMLEYGEYKANLYGTSLNSVDEIIRSGRTPILNPHPQSLRLLRIPSYKPIVIFCKPPPLAALRESRRAANSRNPQCYLQDFSDDDLLQMISLSLKLECQFGPLCEYTLVNGNLELAYRQLVEYLDGIATRASWVPVSWV